MQNLICAKIISFHLIHFEPFQKLLFWFKKNIYFFIRFKKNCHARKLIHAKKNYIAVAWKLVHKKKISFAARKLICVKISTNKVHRPWYFQWYVDDIFVLFKPSDHLKRFQSYLNSCHVNMSFTIETEQNNKISFLDVNVIREQSKFIPSVYRKPTFSAVYTHFDTLYLIPKKLAWFTL